MAEKKKKATDRGIVVKNPLPEDPDNIRLSKSQFIEKEKLRKEKEIKLREVSDAFDKEHSVEEKKKPKKIE